MRASSSHSRYRGQLARVASFIISVVNDLVGVVGCGVADDGDCCSGCGVVLATAGDGDDDDSVDATVERRLERRVDDILLGFPERQDRDNRNLNSRGQTLEDRKTIFNSRRINKFWSLRAAETTGCKSC